MNRISFETISEVQQTEVLKYLEATNTDDIEEATKILSRYDFNSSQAISQRFNSSNTQNVNVNRVNAQPNPQEERQLLAYFNHVQSEYQSRTVVRILGMCAVGLARWVTRTVARTMIPQCIKDRIYYSYFDAFYKKYSKVTLYSTTLEEVFDKGRYQDKSCAIFMAPRSVFKPKMKQLLRQQNTLELFNKRFVCYGLANEHKEAKRIFGEQPVPTSATLIICYKTIFAQSKVIRRYNLEEQQQKVNDPTKESLEDDIKQYRRQRKHEKNIIIRYNNRLLAYYHNEEAQQLIEDEIPEDESVYENERTIREQQKREYEEAMLISKKLEEERLQKQKQQQELKKSIVQQAEQRKLRKMSIPDEPTQGDIVTLNFRCPTGRKLKRNFLKTDNVELIYNWVETNDEIEFEEESRKFQLLHSYPPAPLASDQRLIGEVFVEDQEVVLIKEL